MTKEESAKFYEEQISERMKSLITYDDLTIWMDNLNYAVKRNDRFSPSKDLKKVTFTTEDGIECDLNYPEICMSDYKIGIMLNGKNEEEVYIDSLHKLLKPKVEVY